ncbi:MAG: hypothetical protein NTU59_04945 [Coprothermobacterota bacterium]|nr:hypothetical protein [Coprothermobacterota bacterium]
MDGLRKYGTKRTFDRMPDLARNDPHETQEIFVVAKHGATHYPDDFQLEIKDIPASWAVPKGLSMNFKDRRLPMLKRGQLRLFSRNHRDLTDHFPELHRLPRSLKRDRAVLDGEIVALGQDGKPSFLRLQKRIHPADSIQVHQAQALAPLVFILFDILWWQSQDA